MVELEVVELFPKVWLDEAGGRQKTNIADVVARHVWSFPLFDLIVYSSRVLPSVKIW